MKTYSQEEQNQILRRLNAGVIGKRKQGNWNKIAKTLIYTDKEVFELGKQYKTKDEFHQNHPGAFSYARRYNLFKKMTHFDDTNNRKTKEDVINYIEQGLKDGSIIKFRDIARQGGANLYTLRRLGIEREVKEKYFGYDFTPKPKKERVRGKWTLEYSKKIASTFKSKTEMFKKAQQGYKMLKKYNLLNVYFPKKK